MCGCNLFSQHLSGLNKVNPLDNKGRPDIDNWYLATQFKSADW